MQHPTSTYTYVLEATPVWMVNRLVLGGKPDVSAQSEIYFKETVYELVYTIHVICL